MNQGAHTIDLLLWLCGPVSTVYAEARTATHKRIDVEDVVCATIAFDEGGIGSVVVSTSTYPGSPARLALYGTSGSAVIEGGRLANLAIKDSDIVEGEGAYGQAVLVAQGGTRAAASAATTTSDVVDPAEVWGEGHRRQLLDFVEALEDDGKPSIDGHDGRRAVALIRAIYESARLHKPIVLNKATT